MIDGGFIFGWFIDFTTPSQASRKSLSCKVDDIFRGDRVKILLKLNERRLGLSLEKMIGTMRNSRSLLGILLLAIAVVVFCPHSAHKEWLLLADFTHGHGSPANMSNGECISSTRDHAHCEFDVPHSHDFNISSGRIFPSVSTQVAALPLDTACVVATLRYAKTPGIWGDLYGKPIVHLSTVRLLL